MHRIQQQKEKEGKMTVAILEETDSKCRRKCKLERVA